MNKMGTAKQIVELQQEVKALEDVISTYEVLEEGETESLDTLRIELAKDMAEIEKEFTLNYINVQTYLYAKKYIDKYQGMLDIF